MYENRNVVVRQQAFKAASLEAGVGLLAEGMEQELAPSLTTLDSAIVSVATAQAALLQRIAMSMEGERSSMLMRGLA